MVIGLGQIRHWVKSSLLAIVAGASAFFIVAGLAQEKSASPDAAPVTSASPASLPAQQPGFIDAFTRWMQQGAAGFQTNMKKAQEHLSTLGNQAREATKDATGAVVGLPNARVVNAREQCALAQNGAPDCQAAAVTLCRGKGFQTGKVLDTQSEQKCKSARFLLEGRTPTNTECPTHMFVTRAVCQ